MFLLLHKPCGREKWCSHLKKDLKRRVKWLVHCFEGNFEFRNLVPWDPDLHHNPFPCYKGFCYISHNGDHPGVAMQPLLLGPENAAARWGEVSKGFLNDCQLCGHPVDQPFLILHCMSVFTLYPFPLKSPMVLFPCAVTWFIFCYVKPSFLHSDHFFYHQHFLWFCW